MYQQLTSIYYVFVVSIYIVKTYVDNDDIHSIINISNPAIDTFGHYHIYLYMNLAAVSPNAAISRFCVEPARIGVCLM